MLSSFSDSKRTGAADLVGMALICVIICFVSILWRPACCRRLPASHATDLIAKNHARAGVPAFRGQRDGRLINDAANATVRINDYEKRTHREKKAGRRDKLRPRPPRLKSKLPPARSSQTQPRCDGR